MRAITGSRFYSDRSSEAPAPFLQPPCLLMKTAPAHFLFVSNSPTGHSLGKAHINQSELDSNKETHWDMQNQHDLIHGASDVTGYQRLPALHRHQHTHTHKIGELYFKSSETLFHVLFEPLPHFKDLGLYLEMIRI